MTRSAGCSKGSGQGQSPPVALIEWRRRRLSLDHPLSLRASSPILISTPLAHTHDIPQRAHRPSLAQCRHLASATSSPEPTNPPQVILNCAEENVGFYKRCGFEHKRVSMVCYLPAPSRPRLTDSAISGEIRSHVALVGWVAVPVGLALIATAVAARILTRRAQ